MPQTERLHNHCWHFEMDKTTRCCACKLVQETDLQMSNRNNLEYRIADYKKNRVTALNYRLYHLTGLFEIPGYRVLPLIWLLQMSHLLVKILISLSARDAFKFTDSTYSVCN